MICLNDFHLNSTWYLNIPAIYQILVNKLTQYNVQMLFDPPDELLSGRHEGYRRTKGSRICSLTYHGQLLSKKHWSSQDILPAGLNVLLANAECRIPPTAVSVFCEWYLFTSSDREKVYHICSFDHEIVNHLVPMYLDNKKPSQALKPRKVSTMNNILVSG